MYNSIVQFFTPVAGLLVGGILLQFWQVRRGIAPSTYWGAGLIVWVLLDLYYTYWVMSFEFRDTVAENRALAKPLLFAMASAVFPLIITMGLSIRHIQAYRIPAGRVLYWAQYLALVLWIGLTLQHFNFMRQNILMLWK
ncbi:hypothetical protein P0Y35_06315 [Kiritimatiellaeota bacterium B1221]|nr:hypothetical protein [Kiritimatiellaeota bacterium B1221]